MLPTDPPENRSSTVPGMPARRSKSRIVAELDINAAEVAKDGLNIADAGAAAIEAACSAAKATEQMPYYHAASTVREHGGFPAHSRAL